MPCVTSRLRISSLANSNPPCLVTCIGSLSFMWRTQYPNHSVPIDRRVEMSFLPVKFNGGNSLSKTMDTFPSVLYQMTCDPRSDIIRWHETGSAILIDTSRFDQEIVRFVPEYLSEPYSLGTFTLQLNAYEFTRDLAGCDFPNTFADSSRPHWVWIYHHAFFKRGCLNLLSYVKLKDMNLQIGTNSRKVMDGSYRRMDRLRDTSQLQLRHLNWRPTYPEQRMRNFKQSPYISHEQLKLQKKSSVNQKGNISSMLKTNYANSLCLPGTSSRTNDMTSLPTTNHVTKQRPIKDVNVSAVNNNYLQNVIVIKASDFHKLLKDKDVTYIPTTPNQQGTIQQPCKLPKQRERIDMSLSPCSTSAQSDASFCNHEPATWGNTSIYSSQNIKPKEHAADVNVKSKDILEDNLVEVPKTDGIKKTEAGEGKSHMLPAEFPFWKKPYEVVMLPCIRTKCGTLPVDPEIRHQVVKMMACMINDACAHNDAAAVIREIEEGLIAARAIKDG